MKFRDYMSFFNEQCVKYFSPITNVTQLLKLWKYRIQYRKELCQMDRRLLRDIGLTITDAIEECKKPFWRG